MQYPEPIARLIASYMNLPGIGQKTATRLAFYTIEMKDEVVTEFAKSLLSAKRDYMPPSLWAKWRKITKKELMW